MGASHLGKLLAPKSLLLVLAISYSLPLVTVADPLGLNLFKGIFLKPLIGGRTQLKAAPQLGNMNLTETIQSHGYTAEAHEVSTKDGWILTIFQIRSRRIPRHKAESILLMQGLFNSPADWVLVSKERALPYLLVDLGYDVWIGNYRGSPYAMKHRTLTPKDKAFWDFSYHEMGFYDVPAVIDYVLKVSQRSEISYVGYSMGCSMFAVCMTLLPEYNTKVRTMIALAPAIYLFHAGGMIKSLATIPVEILMGHFDLTNNGEFSFAVLEKLRNHVTKPKKCDTGLRPAEDCIIKLARTLGLIGEEGNATTLIKLFKHFPTRTSIRTILHFVKGAKTGGFSALDYGPVINMKKYQKTEAPVYNLTKLTVTIYTLSAASDRFTKPADCQKFCDEVENCKNRDSTIVENLLFQHGDFVLHDKVKEFVYDRIIKYLSS